MSQEIQKYNQSQSPVDREICNLLYEEINLYLAKAEKKIQWDYKNIVKRKGDLERLK